MINKGTITWIVELQKSSQMIPNQKQFRGNWKQKIRVWIFARAFELVKISRQTFHLDQKMRKKVSSMRSSPTYAILKIGQNRISKELNQSFGTPRISSNFWDKKTLT